MKWLRGKPWQFNLFLGFLTALLVKLALQFLPALPAVLICAALFALGIFAGPTKQEQQEAFKQKIEESKKNWRQLNK